MRKVSSAGRNMLYDGSLIHYYPDEEKNRRHYAYLVKGGHCGSGYFIPMLLAVSTRNKDLMTDLLRNSAKVKKSNKLNIINMKEITKAQFKAIKKINEYDEYMTTNDVATVDDLYERRVILPEFVDGRYIDENNNRKIKENFDLRTVDEYDEKYVLQRYCAPILQGNKLVVKHYIDMNAMLDEFFYYNTLEYGIKREDRELLALYYEMYGKNNNLGIEYSKGDLWFLDEEGNKKRVLAPNKAIPYLERIKNEVNEEEQDIIEEDIKIKNGLERFNLRYNKKEEERQ